MPSRWNLLFASCLLTLASMAFTAAAAPGEEDVVVLADFETAEQLQRWKAGVKNDHRGPHVTWSEEHATSGSRSMRLEFPRHQSGLAPWVILVGDMDRKAFTVTDWSGYDTVTMDIYNPLPEKRLLRFSFIDFQGRRVGPRDEFPPGWTRVRFSIDAMAREGLQTHQMNSILFLLRTPEKDAVFYIDNIRLEKLTAARLAAAKQQLSTLEGLATLLGGELREGLLAEIASLRSRLTGEELDAEAARQIQAEAAGLMNRYRGGLTGALFDAGSRLFPARPQDMTLDSFHAGGDAPPDLRLDDPRRMADRAALLARQSLLQRKLEEHRPGPLAVGVLTAPQPEELIYHPRIFDGPLNTAVRLHMAANEVEAACLTLIPNGREARNVRFSAGPLRSREDPDLTLPADCVRIQPLGYRREDPDAPARAWILRPDIDSLDIPADAQHALWLTVRTPAGTPAGEYEGQITITADGIEPVRLPLRVGVWPFELPQEIRLPVVTAYNVSEQADRLVAEHRVNCGRIYQWPDPPSVETIRRRTELGTTMNNLLRISRMGKTKFEKGPDGELRVTEKWKRIFFRKLDRIVPELKKQGLLETCYVYGFDEATFHEVPAMEEIYGEIRQRYGLKTMFCALLPLWEQYPEIRNVDYYSVVRRNLSPEVVALIRRAGSQVWTHNLIDAFPRSRTQFWAAWRLGLDGLMHYGLRSGGWETDPEMFPIEDGPAGGMVLRVAGGGEEITGYGTLAFEHWRDGSEDVEYLVLLDELCRSLKRDELGPDARRLLDRARYWLTVPEALAPPIWGEGTPEGPEPTAAKLAEVRRTLAELIVQLSRRAPARGE